MEEGKDGSMEEEFRKMRRFKQEITKDECIKVLREAPRGVLALHGENGYPYAIPLNQFYNDEDGRLYFHGALQGLKLDLLAKDKKVCFTTIDEGFKKEGEWPWHFRSVVCLGRMEIVEDREKVHSICRKLAERFYPTEESIEEEIRKAGSRVNVLVMSIDRMTGKLVKEA